MFLASDIVISYLLNNVELASKQMEMAVYPVGSGMVGY